MNFFKKFSIASPKGFTLVEVTLVVSLFFILVGLATVNLFNFQHKSQLDATVNSFQADYKEQQIKAMVGDTEGTSASTNYGVHFETTSYTLFRGTYTFGNSANFVVVLPNTVTIATNFSNAQILFLKGSGEVSGTGTITLTDTVTAAQKVLTINKYGVITGVN